MDLDLLRTGLLATGIAYGYFRYRANQASGAAVFALPVMAALTATYLVILASAAPPALAAAAIALSIGVVVGFLAADHAMAKDGEGVAGLLRSSVVGVVAAGLMLFVVFPNEFRGLMQRLQGFEAVGVKFSIGPAGGNALAQSIKSSRNSGDALTRVESDPSQRGFSSKRLEKLFSLTFPPAAEALPPLDQNPSAALFKTWDEHAANSVVGMQVRQAARDRAYIAMSIWGDAPGQGQPAWDSVPPAGLQAILRKAARIGTAQEQVLLSLGMHIECIARYVEATKDIRVIRSEVDGIVLGLASFAATWSELEFDLQLGRVSRSDWVDRSPKVVRAADALFVRLDALQTYLAQEMTLRFVTAPTNATSCENVWTRTKRDVFRRLAGFDRTAAERTMVNNREVTGANFTPQPIESGSGAPATAPDAQTAKPGNSSLFDFAFQGSGSIDEFQKVFQAGGVSPYLSLTAAYALGAIGAHKAATAQLLRWLDRRTELEQELRRQSQARTVRFDIESNTALMAALSWYRLQVATEMVVLTAFAEQSGELVRVGEAALGTLIRDFFPPTLVKLRESRDLIEWRRSKSNRQCRDGGFVWKQAFVASYLDFVEEYLKLRYINYGKPNDVSVNDLSLAEQIADIEPSCFSIIEGPADQLNSQMSRYVTSTAIRLNALVDPDRLGTAARSKLAADLDTIVRTVLDENAYPPTSAVDVCGPNGSPRSPEYQLACQLERYTSRDMMIRGNARSLKSLLDEVSKGFR